MSMKRFALLFPGQGAQSVGMGRDLYESLPAARRVFDEADEALGFSLSSIIFEGPEEKLTLTEYTQPALLTCRYAGRSLAMFIATKAGARYTAWFVYVDSLRMMLISSAHQNRLKKRSKAV